MAASDRGGQRRGWAAAGTIAAHVAVFVWLATRPPEPPPPPVIVLQDIELIDAAELPVAAEIDEGPAPTQDEASPSVPPDEEPEPEPGEPAAPRDTPLHPPRARPGGSEAVAGATKPSVAPDVPSADGGTIAPQPGALAISGLRRQSTSGGIAVARPSLPPPTHSLSRHAVGSDAVFAPEPSDAKPPSIAAAGFKPKGRSGKLVYKHRKFRATLHPDGRMTFSDMPSALPSKAGPPQKGMQGPPGGNMPGAAEAFVKASGQELYVREKRELLEWTYELRVQMAIEYAEANIDRRLKSLYRDLVSRWHAPGRTAEERREEIFDRWDECEESFAPALPGFVKDTPESIDAKRREAGETARATIERFVRTHLAEGSADAFTADELRRFNAHRRSRVRFDPYGGE